MTPDVVKGFRDFSGEDAEKRAEIRKILVETFEKYGFEPAETPVIEYEEFVKGENQNDEVVSDIFKLKDKGKRDLALRYEFTFQLKRLAKNKKFPYKRYQIGEVFRDEPVSANRLRQFVQCDVDVVGSTIKDEAEILVITEKVLDKFGVKAIIYVGNRKMFKGVAKILFGLEDTKSINELIRYFDKLDKKTPREIMEEIEKDTKKSPALKKIQKAQLKNIFLLLLNTLRNSNLEELKKYYLGILKNRGQEKSYDNSLFKEGYEEIMELINYCKNYGIKIQFNGALVRGLSYYNGNVFEIKGKEVRETLIAGGSYLVGENQATGISFGLDRLMNLAKIKNPKEKFLIVSLEQDKEAIKIAEQLRNKGEICLVYYGKPSKALEYANSRGINKVIFVGGKEVKSKKFKIKDMKSGKERELGI